MRAFRLPDRSVCRIGQHEARPSSKPPLKPGGTAWRRLLTDRCHFFQPLPRSTGIALRADGQSSRRAAEELMYGLLQITHPSDGPSKQTGTVATTKPHLRKLAACVYLLGSDTPPQIRADPSARCTESNCVVEMRTSPPWPVSPEVHVIRTMNSLAPGEDQRTRGERNGHHCSLLPLAQQTNELSFRDM